MSSDRSFKNWQSDREIAESIMDEPFEVRVEIAKEMIYAHSSSGEDIAYLINDVPDKHNINGEDVAFIIATLLKDIPGRDKYEDICARLLNGYSDHGRKDLMQSIFNNGQVIKTEDRPWSPTENLSKAIVRHISDSNILSNRYQLATLFTQREIRFNPDILEAYFQKLDPKEIEGLLVDIISARRIVSKDKDERERQFLDVFIQHLGLEKTTEIVIDKIHTLLELNNNDLVHNTQLIIDKLGGDSFIVKYMESEMSHKHELAEVLLVNMENACKYPSLKEFTLSNWNKILCTSRLSNITLIIYEYMRVFENVSKLITKSEPEKVQSLILFVLGENSPAEDDVFEKMLRDTIERGSANFHEHAMMAGIGVESLSKAMNISSEGVKALPIFFPNESGKRLSHLFPKYKRHGLESDLGL